MNNKMTRQEFLIYLGSMALVITGVHKLVKTLGNPKLMTESSKSEGFGSGPYGGVRKD